MDAAALAVRLADAFKPYHVADWELDEYAEGLGGLAEGAQLRILELIGSLWPVSHALTFSFLRNAGRGVAVFGETRLQIWVGAILDAYEAGGLEEAVPLVADGGRAFLAELRGEAGVRFRDVAPRLGPYLCGLAGRHLELVEGREAATDTVVVWLPRRMAALDDPEGNATLYKLAAALQWAHLASGTYRAEIPPEHPLLAGLALRYGTVWEERPAWLLSYCALFPDPELAQRLFHAAATVRAAARLVGELPGLAHAAAPALAELFARRKGLAALGARARFFEAIRRRAWLGEETDSGAEGAALALLEPLRSPDLPPSETVLAVAGLYRLAAALPEGGAEGDPLPFEGILQPSLAEERRRARRAEARELFIEAFSALVLPGADRAEVDQPAEEAAP